MEELLAPALSEVPLEQRKAQIFGFLMREFKRVVTSYPITTGEIEDLKSRMDEEWKKAQRGR